MKKILFFCMAACLSLGSGMVFTSCDDDDDKKVEKPGEGDEKLDEEVVYVLNQGPWGGNGSLTAYFADKDSTVANIFKDVNGRELGNIPQDILLYGSKLWISVSGSNVVDVLDATTCRSLKQITLEQPRQMAFHDGHVYVTCYDGFLACIDTVNYEIVAKVETKLNPEGIAISNNKIFVANSGGMNYNNGLDNRVSVYKLPVGPVFNPSELEFIKDITVAVNPVTLKTVDNNTLMLISQGIYDDEENPVVVQKIDTRSDVVKEIKDMKAYTFAVKNNSEVYYYDTDYANPSEVGVFDWKNEKSVTKNFTSDQLSFKMPYSLEVSSYSETVCVGDAISYDGVKGTAYLLDVDGKKVASFETGVNPYSIAFRKK